MLENIHNNSMYTTIPQEINYDNCSEDEHILEIIEYEEEKIQEQIDGYLEQGGY